jgi:myosin-crossreactive antigen
MSLSRPAILSLNAVRLLSSMISSDIYSRASFFASNFWVAWMAFCTVEMLEISNFVEGGMLVK